MKYVLLDTSTPFACIITNPGLLVLYIAHSDLYIYIYIYICKLLRDVTFSSYTALNSKKTKGLLGNNSSGSVSANSQMKCQSRPADNLSDNNETSKPSGAYDTTSYDAKNATDVLTKEGLCLMDDPLKLNLQEKNVTSLLPEGVDYQAMAESRVVHIGQDDDISTDSINTICSEQFKVCVCVCVCVCMCCVCVVCVCVCVYVCVCVRTCTHSHIHMLLISIINPLQLQGSIPDSEGSHSNDTQEHWATELTLHCEAIHVMMVCKRCSRTVDCQLCPVCQGPISIVYLPY